MALNDVMPLASATGGHTRIVHYPLTGSQTFYAGDLVKLVSGLLVIGVDEPLAQTSTALAESALLIAAENSFVTTFPNGVATNTSKPANTMIACYAMLPGDSLLCKLYSTDGAGMAAAITPSTVRGTPVGFVIDAASPPRWFADSHTNTNKIGIVDSVVSVPSATQQAGLFRQDLTTATSQASGAFNVIVRIGRDLVAGAA